MIADASIAGINIIRAEDSKNALIQNILIVGSSYGNPPNITISGKAQGIKLARADWLELKNITFYNFNDAALHACSSCENIC